ncbi:MAG TPA: radical SAM protein [Patescibacteria group bacterium]|nr:radical SAM protein [Patescibacteria group bacterium]
METTSRRNESKEFRFYYPYPRFPSVSVTGANCGLNCKHCGGHYLGHMPNVDTPEKLREFSLKLEASEGTGLLVSGGSTPDGKVPLDGFISTLRWIKENTSLIVNLHTGLLSWEQAEELASTGADIASVDVIGSPDTIRDVYGLDATVDDYSETLHALVDAGVPQVAPHICVGLDFGRTKGELRALELCAEIEPEVIVLLGLIPTSGTPMADVTPPSMDDIVKIASEARRISPSSEVSLGCMRSRTDKAELEWMAIESGVSRVALPARATVAKAKELGYTVKTINGCCTIPRSLEERALRG